MEKVTSVQPDFGQYPQITQKPAAYRFLLLSVEEVGGPISIFYLSRNIKMLLSSSWMSWFSSPTHLLNFSSSCARPTIPVCQDCPGFLAESPASHGPPHFQANQFSGLPQHITYLGTITLLFLSDIFISRIQIYMMIKASSPLHPSGGQSSILIL